MITCHYCQSFKDVPKSLRRMVGDAPKPKVSYRYCRPSHKEVTCQSTACQQFTPTRYIWCERYREWAHIVVCLNNHKVRKHGCVTCKQYKNEISDVARGRDLYSHFGLKRNNHTNNKNICTKPKLRRRPK